MTKRPQMKRRSANFFGRDWRADTRLRSCGYAARGLWIDMISLMIDETDHVGCLIKDGLPLDARKLATSFGGSPAQVGKLLEELEEAKVFSRAGDASLADDVRANMPEGLPADTIISRRMIRDRVRSEEASRHGKTGGNPALKPEDNPTPEPEGKPPPISRGLTPLVKPQTRPDLTRSDEPTTAPEPARDPPAASPSDRRMAEADAIALEFLRLRDHGWPTESRLTSPLATLRTQALSWVDAGGTAALCGPVMAKVCEEKRARGESAPTNLGFCRLSMDTAIAKANAEGQAPATRPGHDPELARLEQTPGTPEWAWAQAVDRWSARGGKGPMPSLEDYRAKAKKGAA